jgi:hypothetical protein
MNYLDNNCYFEEFDENSFYNYFNSANLTNYQNSEQKEFFHGYNSENNNIFYKNEKNVNPQNDSNNYFEDSKNECNFMHLDNNSYNDDIFQDIDNGDNTFKNDDKLDIKEGDNLVSFKPITEPKSNINVKSTKSTTKSNFTKIGSIFGITKEEKKNLGRKRKNSAPGKHNKNSPDNIIRKIKSKLFSAILLFLNISIKGKYRLYKLKQEIIKDIGIKNNRELLNCKLKVIFSNEISSKYINYGADNNKIVIEKIYKDNKDLKTIKILEKTFLECLEHYRGTKYFNELAGLENEYKTAIKEFEDKNESNKYIDNFKNLVNNYEKYYQVKFPRTINKKNN